jgi:hypothetical protein
VASALTLRTLSNSGDTTKSAPLTNAEIDQNLINLRNAATVTVLDDLTNSFDNTTKTFNLTSNFSAVTVDSPHALLITLGNMILTPYVINTYEQYIFPQEMDVVPSGNYTVSSNVITFADAPLTTQRFYGRLLGTYINTTDTVTRNVFRAVPVVLS